MTEDERWDLLNRLDDTLLKGGIILSEWCSFIIKESDTAFAKGAHLPSILTAVAGIETYLRSEYENKEQMSFNELINESPIKESLKAELHKLRKYRNKWVHIKRPWQDTHLLENPEKYEKELEEMAIFAAHCLRKTIYENQWI